MPQKVQLRESQQHRIFWEAGSGTSLTPHPKPRLPGNCVDGAGNNTCFVIGSELPSFCGRLSPPSLMFRFSEGSKLPKTSAKRIGTAENSSPQLQVFQSLFALAASAIPFSFFRSVKWVGCWYLFCGLC